MMEQGQSRHYARRLLMRREKTFTSSSKRIICGSPTQRLHSSLLCDACSNIRTGIHILQYNNINRMFIEKNAGSARMGAID